MRLFTQATATNVFLLRVVLRYFLKNKGKQIRPILVLLSAGLHGRIENKAHVGAALVELLHTATLLHDDVVDNSDQRRGWLSINAVWRNKIAVLLGDFLLSCGLRLALRHRAYDLLDMVCEVVEKLSEGEILQAQKARTRRINEAIYYEIIEKKTASLWAACCKMGALSTEATVEQQDNMYALGTALGLAFQMRDDLLDYEISHQTGKPLGIDLKEKKLTLPILRALTQGDSRLRSRLKQGIRRNNYDQVVACLRQTDALTYTQKAMQQQVDRACELLAVYPDSPYKTALLQLANYTMRRYQ